VRFKKIETLTSGTGLAQNRGISRYQRAEYDISDSSAIVRMEYSVMTMVLARSVSFHPEKSSASMIMMELIERIWRHGVFNIQHRKQDKTRVTRFKLLALPFITWL